MHAKSVLTNVLVVCTEKEREREEIWVCQLVLAFQWLEERSKKIKYSTSILSKLQWIISFVSWNTYTSYSRGKKGSIHRKPPPQWSLLTQKIDCEVTNKKMDLTNIYSDIRLQFCMSKIFKISPKFKTRIYFVHLRHSFIQETFVEHLWWSRYYSKYQ